jgi:hypothetical protein
VEAVNQHLLTSRPRRLRFYTSRSSRLGIRTGIYCWSGRRCGHHVLEIISVHLGRARWADPKHEKKARPRHGTARNNLVPGRHGPLYRAGLGRGHGPWAGTGTARLRQARNGPYRGTKRPIYLLKPHFTPHFHILDKEHKARDNAS